MKPGDARVALRPFATVEAWNGRLVAFRIAEPQTLQLPVFRAERRLPA